MLSYLQHNGFVDCGSREITGTVRLCVSRRAISLIIPAPYNSTLKHFRLMDLKKKNSYVTSSQTGCARDVSCGYNKEPGAIQSEKWKGRYAHLGRGSGTD